MDPNDGWQGSMESLMKKREARRTIVHIEERELRRTHFVRVRRMLPIDFIFAFTFSQPPLPEQPCSQPPIPEQAYS